MAVFKSSSKKFKYNFIDFIFLVVVVTLIGVGIWAVANKSPKTTDPQRVTFTIEVHNVESDIAVKLAAGDIISNVNTKSVLGTVDTVSVKPEKIECVVNKTVETVNDIGEAVTSVEKTIELVDSLLYNTVVITCKAQADIDKSAISVNGVRILTGETVDIYSRAFAGEGVITSIYKAGEDK